MSTTRSFRCLYALASLLLLACETEDTAAVEIERGPLGKADASGSCMGSDGDHCGGRSDGACWCDDECEAYGDCCADREAVCEADEPESGEPSNPCDEGPGAILDGVSHYDTIAAAVGVAAPGATVEICPGTYDERIIVTRNITIIGAGPEATIVRGTGGGAALHIGNPTTTSGVVPVTASVSGITLTGAGRGLQVGSRATVTLSHAVVRDNAGAGIRVYGSTYGRGSLELNDVTIERNVEPTEYGGGLSISLGNVVGHDVRIHDNVARSGAGISVGSGHFSSRLELTHASILRNRVHPNPAGSDPRGGGVHMSADAEFVAHDVDFGRGVDDNIPDDVALYPSYGETAVEYAWFGPGEDMTCRQATMQCVLEHPSSVASGPTSAHCDGPLPIDLDGVARYDSLAAAVRAAPPDAYVSLCPGTYTGGVLAERSINIVGVDGPRRTRIVGTSAAPVIRFVARQRNGGGYDPLQARLEGVEVSGGSSGVSVGTRANVHLERVRATANEGPGVGAGGSTYGRAVLSMRDVTLDRNVHRSYGGGLSIALTEASGTNVTITDNRAVGGAGIWVGSGHFSSRLELTGGAVLRNRTDASLNPGSLNRGGGALLDTAAELVAHDVDFGIGSDNNVAEDVGFRSSGPSAPPGYTWFGAGSSFVCRQASLSCE